MSASKRVPYPYSVWLSTPKCMLNVVVQLVYLDLCRPVPHFRSIANVGTSASIVTQANDKRARIIGDVLF